MQVWYCPKPLKLPLTLLSIIPAVVGWLIDWLVLPLPLTQSCPFYARLPWLIGFVGVPVPVTLASSHQWWIVKLIYWFVDELTNSVLTSC